ncbi:MAG TPA: GrpB family protein [Longimicrobium sp.]|nr:GrpB family protein [Longimicrobium sp.]
MNERVAFGNEKEFREAARRAYEEHHRALGALLPRARIEHVGSTAVPGSVTKGDLDICVLVDPADFLEADALLAGRCARNHGSIHTTSFAAFTVDGGAIDVGIQLVAAGSEWDTFVRWRDLLRSHPVLRRAYDELKRRYDGGPMDDYRAAKASFIGEALSGRQG